MTTQEKLTERPGPSPKGDGFGVRLKSAKEPSRRAGSFGDLKGFVVLGLGTLKLYVLRYDFIGHVTARRYKPVSPIGDGGPEWQITDSNVQRLATIRIGQRRADGEIGRRRIFVDRNR